MSKLKIDDTDVPSAESAPFLNKRYVPRVTIPFPVNVHFFSSRTGGLANIEGLLTSLSEGGASFAVSTDENISNALQLNFIVPESHVPVRASYEIRWKRVMKNEQGFEYGVRLTHISPQHLTAVRDFIIHQSHLRQKLFAPKSKSANENIPRSENSDSRTLSHVRQDRIKSAEKVLFLEIDGKAFEVVDYTAFGVAVRCAQPLPLNGETLSVRLLLECIEVDALEVKQIRNEEKEDGFVSAFEIVGRSLSVEKIATMKMAFDKIHVQKQKAQRYAAVPFEFRAKVYETQHFLTELEREVNELSTHAPKNVYQDLAEFEQAVCHVVGGFLTQFLPPVYDELADCLGKLPVADRPVVLDFFRQQIKRFLYQAPFAQRSFTKPLGYAGDYEVMNLIYRDQPEGATLFAKCLHRYFIDQPAARAVRNRVGYLQTHFKKFQSLVATDQPLRILSVASGPALELQALLKNQSFWSERKIEIFLLDQDIESLKHAQRRLLEIVRATGKNCKINYIHRTIRNVIGRGLEMGDFDFIYSLGLFDYLSDSVCQALAKQLFKALRPGGRLVIGNFDVSNPTRNTMEMALDWNLIYRSESDMLRLFNGLDGSLRIEREEEKINLFGVLKKNKLEVLSSSS